jgi:GTP-binding protein
VLVDPRHDPSPWDMAVMELAEQRQRPFVVMLTKCDKLSRQQLQERVAQLQQLLAQCTFVVEILPTSARTGMGREQLLAVLRRYCMASVA